MQTNRKVESRDHKVQPTTETVVRVDRIHSDLPREERTNKSEDYCKHASIIAQGGIKFNPYNLKSLKDNLPRSAYGDEDNL